MTTCTIITSQAFSLENFRGPLICDLVASGLKVYALAPDYNENTRHKVRLLGAEPVDYEMSRAGIGPLNDVFAFLKLIMLFRRIKPNISLAYFIKPVIYGTTAAWAVGVPQRIALIEGLGYVYTDSSEKPTWHRKLLKAVVSTLYKFALSKANQVVFLNGDDRSEFVSNGLVATEKAEILGGIGVDLNDWQQMPIQISPITFLLAARLLREKGVVEFANAARLVKKLEPRVKFVLLGGLDSNPGALTQTEVQAWVTEGLLDWPGHVDVKPWLAQASAFVLPSYREGLPRSTQEAMASGRAIITTDVPGCRDTVQNGVNGYLVPVRNEQALADAMLHFVHNPHLFKSMGSESRALAEKNFDVYKINKRLIKIMGI
jgi:glycosyltransferase involved in cell wall biosynthesis